MKVSIIIVSWNVAERLKICLNSVFSQNIDNFEIIVVDNHSSDGSPEMVAKDFPLAKLIINSSNLGFAKAVNQGAEVAKGDNLLLLNPDTEMLSGSLASIMEVAGKLPNFGVAGGRLLNPDGSTQPSVRRFPDLASQLLIMLKLHRLLPRLRPLRNYLAWDFDYSRPQPVDQVMGAYFWVTATVWRQLKGFDEDFFVWFEEVDFCWRARDAGYKIWYLPLAPVKHYGGASFNQLLGWKRQRLFNRSLISYFNKRGQRLAGWVLWLLQPISLGLALVGQLIFLKK